MKTFQVKAKEIKREWHLLDAKDKVLGRFACSVAKLLIGKHKVTYTPHMDSGDYVVVINAAGINLTGKKKQLKVYRSHSGYPVGFKEVTFGKLIKEQPEKVIQNAVFGMLPDNRLKKARLTRLKIFAGDKHPYDNWVKGKR